MQVAVIGMGYVGLTAALGLAKSGHDVLGIDHDEHRVALLRQRCCPFHEPDVAEALLTTAVTFRRTLDVPVDAVIIAVSAPLDATGAVDLANVRSVLAELLTAGSLPELVVVKSTIPPGTSEGWAARFPALRRVYTHNPEFLNQGRALADWQAPDRIVLGLWNHELLPLLGALYHDKTAPRVVVGPTEAEAVKYASNAFLATKISFANEIANFCGEHGIDVDAVLGGVALDPRMGQGFWRPGIGYGDSCLGKDVTALARFARRHGRPMTMLESVAEVNDRQLRFPIEIVAHETATGAPPPEVAVLGLLYEPGSDDMRAAPSRTVVPGLAAIAADVRVWDPVLSQKIFAGLFPGVRRTAGLKEAVLDASVVLVLTEFPEVLAIDWTALAQLARPDCLVVDAKNALVRSDVEAAGLRYRGVGRAGGGSGADAAEQDVDAK
ncbi:nucleotide sugar dehydrogenase [Nocardia xishanensis]|uniref:nucleotide sugar dehydrogenase n=1 Tax=Nocardia xishanensis TaxID=238964 RepID=UPI000832D79E|nr:nucleotide sugar dehydrogenase [Nocardia xishanensis]